MLEIKWTKHAIKEVKEELRTDSEEYAQLFIKDSMRQARFISEIMNEVGKIDRLYAYRRFCFVLDRYDDVVITVYKRENVHEEVRQLVQELLFEKLASLVKEEQLIEDERELHEFRLKKSKIAKGIAAYL